MLAPYRVRAGSNQACKGDTLLLDACHALLGSTWKAGAVVMYGLPAGQLSIDQELNESLQAQL